MAVIDQTRTPVIYRDLHYPYPLLVRGEGIYLFDDRGRRYIDGSGGSAAVTAIGHGVPEIANVIAEQASRLAFAPMHAFSTQEVEECARILVEEFAPPGLDRVWFVSGGSEASENAIKIALQYHRDRGQASRQIVIGRWGSYHGATLAALGVGGNAGRRKPYAANLMPAEHIWPCHPYRCQACSACPPCDLSCAEQLDYVIRQVGPENVAAFIAEPVVGATLGAVPATPGYFERIREICDEHGVLFIADEVMSGFGRTGAKFGIDHWGVVPDLITCAKGIAGGYSPLGAVLVRRDIVSDVRQRGRSFVIGHTASGNPLSCATGSAVMRYILDHDLIANAQRIGSALIGTLRERLENRPLVGDVRGLGLLLAVELVADRETKRPFPRQVAMSQAVFTAALEHGLIVYPLQGSADGENGDHLLLAPPLTLTADEATAIAEAFVAAIDQVADRV